MKLNLYALSLIAVAAAGCGGGGDSDATAGPCIVQYAEPIVLVTAATNAATRQPLSQITLSGIRLNGTPVDLSIATANSTGVTIVGNSLRCTLPCGFASTEGAYTFQAESAGYQSAAVTVDARYTSRGGLCPTVLSGGTKVSIALTPV